MAWQFNDAPTDWATPLILDGKLFILDGNKKVLSRLDPKTGAKEWTGTLDSDVMWSSPTGADGKIYMTSEKGTVWVVDAGNEFKILSRLDLDEGPTRSSVVVAHNQLFVRTAKNLYCFGK